MFSDSRLPTTEERKSLNALMKEQSKLINYQIIDPGPIVKSLDRDFADMSKNYQQHEKFRAMRSLAIEFEKKIQQLENDIAKNKISSITWISPKELPTRLKSVIVAGTLQGEDGPAAHEGYWTGTYWSSTYDSGFRNRKLRITNVIAWMPLPTIPSSKVPTDFNLQTCPFCSSEAEMHYTDSGYQVMCSSCLSRTINSYSEEYVANCWNSRGELKPLEPYNL